MPEGKIERARECQRGRTKERESARGVDKIREIYMPEEEIKEEREIARQEERIER